MADSPFHIQGDDACVIKFDCMIGFLYASACGDCVFYILRPFLAAVIIILCCYLSALRYFWCQLITLLKISVPLIKRQSSANERVAYITRLGADSRILPLPSHFLFLKVNTIYSKFIDKSFYRLEIVDSKSDIKLNSIWVEISKFQVNAVSATNYSRCTGIVNTVCESLFFLTFQ